MEPSTTTQPTNPNPAPQAPPAPAAAAPAGPTLPNVPATWPGGFGLYKYSKQAVKTNLGTVVGLLVLNIVLGGLLRSILKQPGQLLDLLVDSLLTAALSIALLHSVRGKVISFGDALSQGIKFWLKALGLTLLIFIALAISIVLLIIPFFLVLPRVTLAYYYLVDKNMGVVDAFKASWNATKGYSGKIWGILGATIAMSLLFITIIGIPFALYFLAMYSAAFALAYEFINKSAPAAVPAVPATPIAPPAAAPPVVS